MFTKGFEKSAGLKERGLIALKRATGNIRKYVSVANKLEDVKAHLDDFDTADFVGKSIGGYTKGLVKKMDKSMAGSKRGLANIERVQNFKGFKRSK